MCFDLVISGLFKISYWVNRICKKISWIAIFLLVCCFFINSQNAFLQIISSTESTLPWEYFFAFHEAFPSRQSFLIHAVRKSLWAARKVPAKLNIDSQQRQCLIWLKILARNTVVCKWLICRYAWDELWFPIVDLGCKIPILWQKTTILSVIT